MGEVEKTLYAEAILGKDADDFFRSDIGKYVLAESEQRVKSATQELIIATADDPERIRNLQQEIHCAEGAVKWLNEMILAGKQAMQQLENIEDEEE